VASLRQQVASFSAPMEGIVKVKEDVIKHNNINDWNFKITESKKFMIGHKDSAFSSKKSRFDYIRILCNAFDVLPTFRDVSFDDLFNPQNGYANFQTLLNMVPIPSDHEGFYINDKKKLHLKSAFLSSPTK
jgi:hypothetical protein